MHQTVQCGTSGSVGDLGRIARKLADEGFNIEAVGGGEADLRGGGVGIVSFLVEPDSDEDLARLQDSLTDLALDNGRTLQRVHIRPGFDLELDNTQGSLADAAELVGSADPPINIMSILLVDAHDGWAVVSIAFEDPGIRDRAAEILGGDGRFTVMPEHGGRRRARRVGKFVDGKVNRGDKDEGEDDDGHGNHFA
jgi:hypothetical protein